MPRAPELSVVLVSVSGTETIMRTIACLRAQTVAEQIEVLVITPSADQVDPVALGAASFAAFRTIEVGPISRRGAAAAAGVRVANAPIVSLLEDHSYPEPAWAAALLAAHRGPWAGVGPQVTNANPESAVSRASFWLGYASMSGPQPAGTRTLLPWHNTAYKRALLLGYGERLGDLLNWEGNLQADLLARGHELFFEPTARTDHDNVSVLSSALGIHYQHGRILAGQRADHERWSVPRRVLYAISAPLFPLMHIAQLRPELRRLRVGARELVLATPALLLQLGAMAIGEAVGHLMGPGDAIARVQDYELRREAHLSPGSRD